MWYDETHMNSQTPTHSSYTTPQAVYLEQLTFLDVCNRIPAILWIFHLAHTCNYWFRYNSCQMTFCPILFGSLDKIQLDRPETCRHFVFPENFNRNVFDEKQTMPNFLPRSEVNQTCLWLCISYLYCVIVCFPFFSRSIKLMLQY